MDTVTVIRGTFATDQFVPDEPPPAVRGRAELIAYAEQSGAHVSAKPANNGTRISIFDLLGKAAVLRSGEDIDAQLEAERDAWGDE
jgi:hypothetical protein